MNTEQVVNWLTNETMRNTAYHNHKESMAWAATAFYISGILTMAFLSKDTSECVVKVLATTFTVVVLIGIYCFTIMQFNNRWVAAGRVEGLIRTIGDIAKGDEPSNMVWVREEGKLYPKCVEDRIPAITRFNSSRMLVEIPSYAVIFAATVVALIVIWVQP